MRVSWLLQSVRRFQQCERGAATIEFVLWLPIVVMVLLLIVDASMLFMGRTQAIRVLQDTNRLYSVGQFTGSSTEKQTKAEGYALTRLRAMSSSATASTTETNRVVRTEATLQTDEIAQVGFLGAMIDVTMTVSAEHRVEF